MVSMGPSEFKIHFPRQWRPLAEVGAEIIRLVPRLRMQPNHPPTSHTSYRYHTILHAGQMTESARPDTFFFTSIFSNCVCRYDSALWRQGFRCTLCSIP
jgi:hypothetical protein